MPTEMFVALLIGVTAFTLLYLSLMSLRLRVTRLREAREQEAWE